MFDFHYNYAKKKWPKIKVLYTDTDSLIYDIPTNNVFKDISEDVEKWFDTSGYPSDFSHLPVGKNKKVLGVFKDECGGKIIKEFVALRAKCYSIKMDSLEEKKTCKGVKKCVKKRITHEDFKKALLGEDKIIKQNLIRSRLHQIYTEKMTKLALSAEDDKRIILPDGINTLAIGHFSKK